MYSNEAVAHCINSKIPKEFLYFYLKNFDFNSLGNTSSIGNAVNSKLIKSINILIPNEDILEKTNLIIEPILNKILKLENKKLNLIKIRDSLLPKLITGVLKIKNLEPTNDY